MHLLRRRLSSLNHLFAVESVGRHLSFTLAAQELGVSQPAVSKAVRATEDALGFPLFERDRRGLRLTPKGKVFFLESRSFLRNMADVVQDLVGETPGAVVRACFSSSFVALWMLPRVQDFRSLHPSIALHLEQSDSDMLDLGARGLDFSARLGDGNWPDLRASLLAEERIGAVASPDYLARNPDIADLGALARADLIHVDEPKRIRIGWRDWFDELRARPPALKAGLTVSDYHSAVDAALMGQGVALGWDHLVGGKIAQGQLVWVGPHRLVTGKGIYLVEPQDGRNQADRTKFRNWILGKSR